MPDFDDIPGDILCILAVLGENGFDAWLVGGCVRDILSGRRPKDYDIATAALPAQTASLFSKTRPTGEKYGTVTVFFGEHSAEVTTFRKEAGYTDFRRPSKIVFSEDITEDLSRRDFTVNAIAYQPHRGVFDPFGGREDLARGLIRAVGDPDERFHEDALRILRAFRFCAEHSYKIEPKTWRAAVKNARLITKLSFERVKAEFDRILLSGNPGAIFYLTGLSPFKEYFTRVRAGGGNGERLLNCPESLRCRWAAFLWIANADAPKTAERFKFDGSLKNSVAALLDVLAAPFPETRAGIKRRLSVLPPDIVSDAILLAGVLTGSDPEPALAELGDILRSGEPYKLSMLALDGSGLKALGIEPGPEFGCLLNALLSAVVEKPALNTPAELTAMAGELHRRFAGAAGSEV